MQDSATLFSQVAVILIDKINQLLVSVWDAVLVVSPE